MACRGGDWKKIPRIRVEIRETENLKCIMKMKVRSGQSGELGKVLPILKFIRVKILIENSKFISRSYTRNKILIGTKLIRKRPAFRNN